MPIPNIMHFFCHNKCQFLVILIFCLLLCMYPPLAMALCCCALWNIFIKHQKHTYPRCRSLKVLLKCLSLFLMQHYISHFYNRKLTVTNYGAFAVCAQRLLHCLYVKLNVEVVTYTICTETCKAESGKCYKSKYNGTFNWFLPRFKLVCSDAEPSRD